MGSLASGQFSDFSLVDWYFLGYTGFNYLYRFLHDLIPQFNWIGAGTYGMTVLGFYLCLRSLHVSLQSTLPLVVLSLLCLAFGLFYMDSLLSISHTRASLIICGGAMVYVLVAPDLDAKRLVGLNAIFIAGLLHRSESAIGVLWVVGLGAVLFMPRPSTLMLRLGPPALWTFLFMLSVSAYWASSDSFIIKVEPEVEYAIMAGNVMDISECKTRQDSAMYRMATYGIWLDPEVVTADYMRSLLTDAPFSENRLFRAFETVSEHIVFYSFFLWLIVLLILYAAFVLRSVKVTLMVTFYVAFCLVPLLYLAYRGLLSERHIFPLLYIIAVISTIYMGKNWKPAFPLASYGKLFAIASLIVLVLSTWCTIDNCVGRNKVRNAEVNCLESAMQKLEATFSDRVVVITTGTFRIMDHNFSFWTDNYTANDYVMYDLFNYSLVPRYVAYQSRLCHCDASDPVQFYSWLSGKNALYIAEAERLNITSSYMDVVHGRNLKFAPVDGFDLDTCVQEHDSFLRLSSVWQVRMD